MKKVIINADDFGYSKEVNEAVLCAYKAGNLTSASLIANMPGYENAVFEIYPQIKDIDLGFHFNMVEGKSLSESRIISDVSGHFNSDFLKILFKSNNKKYTMAVEKEFRMQIEKVLNSVSITHIDTHRHIHAIPKLYELISKLAEEYNIKKVRVQKEIPYIVFPKIFSPKFPPNVVKNVLLNYLTMINSPKKKNNFILGVLYTGMMDEKTIIEGLRSLKDKNAEIEIIMHPTVNKMKKNNYREFLALKNPELKLKIQDLGFKL